MTIRKSVLTTMRRTTRHQLSQMLMFRLFNRRARTQRMEAISENQLRGAHDACTETSEISDTIVVERVAPETPFRMHYRAPPDLVSPHVTPSKSFIYSGRRACMPGPSFPSIGQKRHKNEKEESSDTDDNLFQSLNEFNELELECNLASGSRSCLAKDEASRVGADNIAPVDLNFIAQDSSPYRRERTASGEITNEDLLDWEEYLYGAAGLDDGISCDDALNSTDNRPVSSQHIRPLLRETSANMYNTLSSSSWDALHSPCLKKVSPNQSY
ncbi:uncharacterized protein V1518DRAFT_47752 [Limtongia smithiae]|uniref:uncharacterized protein n=1 Tax=Limtongia smithiae TaxID=1125753 RepID=UPI0034CD2318